MSSAEESATELQRLQERVEQLQAENQRLSGRGTVDNGSGPSGQTARREQALYLPRERRCPKFSGSTSAGSLAVEEWIEEAQSCIRSRELKRVVRASNSLTLLEIEAGGPRSPARCEKIRAVLNAPEPFRAKLHGRAPVVLEAGALTLVPVTCPQLDSVEFLLEPLGFEEEPLPEERLGEVFARLQREGLKVKLSKCRFFQHQVSYLGHVVSAEWVSTDPAKIEVVKEWKRPGHLAELRSFLGFASYYRRVIVIGPVYKHYQEGRYPDAVGRGALSSHSKGLLRQLGRLVLREGVLYRLVHPPGGGPEVHQLLLPQDLQKEVLRSVHDEQGHQGTERTLQLLRSRCFWPSMAKDTEQWCQQCQRCVLGKAVQPKVRAYWGTLLATQLNEILAIDFSVLEPASDGRENILILTDIFTKYSQAIPTRDQRASTVAHALVQYWFYRFGSPALLRGPSGAASVYTVAPVVGEGPVRQVHRSEMRAFPESLQQDDEGIAPPPARKGPTNVSPVVEGEDHAEVVILYTEEEPQVAPVPPRAHSPGVEDIVTEEVPLRRSGRSTAGQHSNPHRLPRTVATRNEDGRPLADGEEVRS
ncbi:hypothetical protein ACEWY4_007595 [Coilia grayii]|uniref:Gypsy retrotransposon integrase-like protein 1 n=1 Tax=Coilia grayii TaxID=363190 RepID=A0ABD1KHP1_9TELE